MEDYMLKMIYNAIKSDDEKTFTVIYGARKLF